MIEQQAPGQWNEPTPLRPHTYPLWVVLAAVLTLLAALYSFGRLPTLVEAGQNLHSGEAALARHDYTTAIAQLERAHEEAPSSRRATILLATADFGANRDQAGLELLLGMKLTQSEWSTLRETMPPSIQAQFQPTN